MGIGIADGLPQGGLGVAADGVPVNRVAEQRGALDEVDGLHQITADLPRLPCGHQAGIPCLTPLGSAPARARLATGASFTVVLMPRCAIPCRGPGLVLASWSVTGGSTRTAGDGPGCQYHSEAAPSWPYFVVVIPVLSCVTPCRAPGLALAPGSVTGGSTRTAGDGPGCQCHSEAAPSWASVLGCASPRRGDTGETRSLVARPRREGNRRGDARSCRLIRSRSEPG